MRRRAWLELLRVSNAPTVVTNVFAGAAAGAAGQVIVPWRVGLVALSGLLMYAAGMALNDVCDAAHDRASRPGRPIPSGRLSRSAALCFAATALAAALLLLLVHVPALTYGCALAAAIVVYNLVHRSHPIGALLAMGTCRGLLVLMAAAMMQTPASIWSVPSAPAGLIAAVVALYTVLVTLVARGEETTTGRAAWSAGLLPIIALGPMALVAIAPPDGAFDVALAGIVWIGFVVWHRRNVREMRRSPPVAIMGWLAGFTLIDAMSLVLLGHRALAAAAVGCFLITVLGHRRILGS